MAMDLKITKRDEEVFDFWKKTHVFPGMTYLDSFVKMEMFTDDVAVLSAFLSRGFLFGLCKLKEPVLVETTYGNINVEHLVFQYSVTGEAKEEMMNIMFYDPALPIEMKVLKEQSEKKQLQYILEKDEINHTGFGSNGFFKDFSTKLLSGNDLACRLFMEQVQKVSKKYHFASRTEPKEFPQPQEPEWEI